MPLQIDPSPIRGPEGVPLGSVCLKSWRRVFTLTPSLPRWPAESFASIADLANPRFHLHIADKHEKLQQV